jgi:hypothetical protein
MFHENLFSTAGVVSSIVMDKQSSAGLQGFNRAKTLMKETIVTNI